MPWQGLRGPRPSRPGHFQTDIAAVRRAALATLRATLDLAQLVDFELQLHRDDQRVRAGEEAALAARDGALGPRLVETLGLRTKRVGELDRSARQALASAFVDACVPVEQREGERFTRGLRRAALLIGGLGLLCGAFAARATLGYDGHTPVNVFVFLAVLVLPQILLLVLLTYTAWRARGSPLAALLGTVGHRLAGRHAAQLGAVSARLALHGEAERWLLFTLAQRAATAFNVGALAACLWLVAFTDLAFGWSTTLQVDAKAVQTGCDAIATPWAWLWPEARPDAELVRASQWVRMPGHFLGGGSLPEAVARSGRWWTFLVAALLVWGLLPRLLAWGYGAWRTRRALRRVELDDRRCDALFSRLLPAVDWQRAAAAEVGLPAHERVGAHASAPSAMVARDATWLLCWGRTAQRQNDLRALVERHTGRAVHGALAIGGADLAADSHALQALGQAQAKRVLLVATAGSQPTKEIVGLLRDLRRELGPRAHLAVALVGDDPQRGLFAPGDDELAAWRVRLDKEGDPNLGVERLPA